MRIASEQDEAGTRDQAAQQYSKVKEVGHYHDYCNRYCDLDTDQFDRLVWRGGGVLRT